MGGRRSRLWNLVRRIVWEARQGRGDEYTLYIVDRVSPTGSRSVPGNMVAGFTGTGGLMLRDGSVIPLHRVYRVERKGAVLFDRELRGEGEGQSYRQE